MSYDPEEFPIEPMTLYTITDIARELSISDATMHYWAAKNALPVPYAVTAIGTGRKQQARYWNEEQKEKILDDYKNFKGVFKNRLKRAVREKPSEEAKLEVVKDQENQNVCGMCGYPVFDMTMHIRFAHDGKYSAVGARQ